MAVAGPEVVIYLKALAVLIVLWRLLTIGAFGQLVSGVLAATLAFCLTRDNALPKTLQDVARPLDDLKRNPTAKFAFSVILDILSTEYVPIPVLLKILVGQSGFVPIGTFLVQFLYDRPILTAVDLLRVQLPFATLIPTASIGWLIENRVIKEEWLGGPNGPFLQI